MGRTRSLIVAAVGDLVVQSDPDRVSGRLLRQADMDASYVDLADPRHLEFDYLRWTRIALRAFGARTVLHLGGAACSLARALLAEDPASRQEVVEVDPRVLAIARDHLGLRRQPGLRVRVGDGRAAAAARPDNSADAVVLDAFLGASVPRHLATAEACGEYRRVAPLALVNIVDTAGWEEARALAACLRSAFPHVVALAGRLRGAGNVVLCGSAVVPPYDRLQQAAAADRTPARLIRAAELEGAAPRWDEPLQ